MRATKKNSRGTGMTTHNQMSRPVSPLTSTIQTNDAPITSMGSVARVGASSASNLQNFTLTCDNSGGGAAAVYIIGDPEGILADILAVPVVLPTSGSISPVAMNRTFGIAPLNIKTINYQTTVSAAQFSEPFQLIEGDIDGSINQKPVTVSAAKRNNAFDDKLLTIDFGNAPINLTWNRAFLLTVAAGETVILTITPGATKGR